MERREEALDGVAALALAGQALFLALFVFGWAEGADLPYALIAGAEFACFGFSQGWMCRKSKESEERRRNDQL